MAKHKSFGSLPRRQRKSMYIGIKNRIRRAKDILGGLFYTDDYLHGRNGWIDCYFLSRNGRTFCNCTLETTRCAYHESVMDAAWDKAEKLAPHPSFDGLTRIEWILRECPGIADSGQITVAEQASLHRDYACGIGLHATIDVPYLTVETVNAFIIDFLKHERPFRGKTQLTYRSTEIDHWGIESNALIEPWNYPSAKTEDSE